jgi:hypothetical protein
VELEKIRQEELKAAQELNGELEQDRQLELIMKPTLLQNGQKNSKSSKKKNKKNNGENGGENEAKTEESKSKSKSK